MEKSALKESLLKHAALLDRHAKKAFPAARLKLACGQISKCSKRLYRAHLSGSALSEGEVWLCDNAFLIEDICRGAKKSVSRVYEGAVRLAERVMQDCEKHFWEEADLEVLFSVCADRGVPDRLLESLPGALICAGILRLAQACTQDGGLVLAPQLIRNLRFFSEADTGSFIESFSRLSGILRADPSGAYRNMSASDCRAFRSEVRRAAKKARVPVERYAKELLERAVPQRAFPGAFLPKTKAPGRWYVICLLGCYFLLCALFASLLTPHLTTELFCIVPLLLIPCCTLDAACTLTDTLFSRFVKPKSLYRLKWDRVPEACKTLTVYTALVHGAKEIETLGEQLKEAYLASCPVPGKEPNLLFGLLLDLPEADSPEKPRDGELKEALGRVIGDLNERYGACFFGFLRARSKGENGRFCGWERKRGALLSLCRYLRGNKEAFTVFGEKEALFNVSFLMTLDADTRLGFLQLQKLIGVLAHPLYRPVIAYKDGRPYVKEGHAILQPLMAPTLEAAYQTPFCVLQSGAGGISAYAGAAFERYQTLFSRGIYCGKGIFRIDEYLEVLSGAFPENRVLSHDLLEGSRLNCAAVTDLCLLDELPKTPLAFGSRAHRWVRGDVQSLFFFLPRSKDASGKRGKNPTPRFWRMAAFDNLRRAFLPVSQALLLLTTPFLPRALARVSFLAALMPLLIPLVTDTLDFLLAGRADPLFRKFFSRATPGVWNRLYWFFYAQSALFWDAYRNLDAIIRALFRMLVSHKKCLEWNTASSVDRARASFWDYCVTLWPSTFCAAFLLALSPSSPVRFFAVLSLFFPVTAYLVSRPFCKRRSQPDVSPLYSYVRDMAGYFFNEVTAFTSFLPPDHLTVAPAKRLANRTSPTNIGLYLESLCALRDFDLLEIHELYARLERAFDSIESLPTYKGLLYNWYDLETLEPIGDYVSFVDCGNYLVSLCALIGALEEEEETPRREKLIKRAKRILDGASLKPFYQPRRNLFCIGLHAHSGQTDNSFYDFYMSEARMSSYFAVSRQDAPASHWAALKRPLVTRGFYLGQASFSGTCFEYFMPLLFLPLCRGSFDEEALFFAAEQQKRQGAKTRLGPVFGISESAYFAFDADGDYPYRAHGVRALSLRNDLPEKAPISPYSSFLMLPVIPKEVLDNLKRLKQLGMYGKYGFYEAGEFTANGEEIVQSFFAHHIGMSLVACANACFDDVFCKRFMRVLSASGAKYLLEEKIPVDAIVRKAQRTARGYPVLLHGAKAQNRRESIHKAPAAVLCPGKDAALAADNGGKVRVIFKAGKSRIDAFCEDGAPALYALVDGTLYSSRAHENPPGANVFWRRENTGVRYEITHGTRSVFFSFLLDAEKPCLNASVRMTGACRSLKIAFGFCAKLAENAQYAAHPAFYTLRLEAVRTQNGLSVIRRAAGRGEEGFALSLFTDGEISCGEALMRCAASDRKRALMFDTLPGFVPGAMASGEVLAVKELNCHEQKTQYEARFLCGFAKEAKLAYAYAKSVHTRSGALVKQEKKQAAALFSHALGVAKNPKIDADFCRRLSYAVLDAKRPRRLREGKRFQREDLYRLSLSGDLPIVLCRVNEEELYPERYRELCAIHRYHALCGFSYDLVFCCRENAYFRRARIAVIDAVRFSGSEYLFGVRGGVFCVEDTGLTAQLLENAACFCVPSGGFVRSAMPENRLFTEPRALPESEREIPQEAVGDRGLYFLKRGFLIEKDQRNPAVQYSHILASPSFGVLLTHKSLGFSFGVNSKFERLSAWHNAPYTESFGERAVLSDAAGTKSDLAAVSAQVCFLEDRAIYRGKTGGIGFELCVVSHPTLQFRAVRVKLRGTGRVRFSYEFEPVLGDENGTLGAFCVRPEAGAIYVSRMIGTGNCHKDGYLAFSSGVRAAPKSDIFGLETELDLHGTREFTVFLGFAASEKHYRFVRGYQADVGFEGLLEDAARSVKARLPVLPEDETPGKTDTERCISRFCRFWLSYQAIVSRLYARLGFYQPGGAFGFRDQLQDALIYLSFAPEKCLEQILRHASHQFLEGDAQHWWHPTVLSERTSLGVRTRISDDYLWLIYAATKYVEQTRDKAALLKKAPYLSCRALSDNERDLYENMPFSKEKEPLYLHLCRAADCLLARKKGALGLAGMFAGDWNDGMDALPENTGSVWLSQFAAVVLRRLSGLLDRRALEPDRAARYLDFARELEKTVQKCYQNGFFARAAYPDGGFLGADPTGTAPCSIDVLTQAFAAFSYLEKPVCERTETEKERVESALEQAYFKLFDKASGVFALFTPPFSRTDPQIGYLCGYAPGVRENGGQYSHAAIFFAYACRAFAPETKDPALWRERAGEVIRALIPADAVSDEEKYRRYELEPYVLCGDVWNVRGKAGRGGWNWYTGAAAWLWRYLFTDEGF